MSQDDSEQSEEINILALAKDGHRYVFLYDDPSHDELLRTLGKYAEDPELNFSWYDMAALSQKVRKLKSKSPNDHTDFGDNPYKKSA